METSTDSAKRERHRSSRKEKIVEEEKRHSRSEKKRRRHCSSSSPHRSSSASSHHSSESENSTRRRRRRHSSRAYHHRRRTSSSSVSPEPDKKNGMRHTESDRISRIRKHDEHCSQGTSSASQPVASHNVGSASLERKSSHKACKIERDHHHQQHISSSGSNPNGKISRQNSSTATVAEDSVSSRDATSSSAHTAVAAEAPVRGECSIGENNSPCSSFSSGSSLCMPSGFLAREKKGGPGTLSNKLARLKALHREEDYMYADFFAEERKAAFPAHLQEDVPTSNIITTSCRAAVSAQRNRGEKDSHEKFFEAADTSSAAVAGLSGAGTNTKYEEKAMVGATSSISSSREATEASTGLSNRREDTSNAGDTVLQGARSSSMLLQQQQQRRQQQQLSKEQQQIGEEEVEERQVQSGKTEDAKGKGIYGVVDRKCDEEEILLEEEDEEEAAEVVRCMRALQRARQTRWTRKGLDVKSMEEQEKAAATVEEEDELAGYGLLEKSFSAVNNPAGVTYDKHLEEFLRERMQLKEVQPNSGAPGSQQEDEEATQKEQGGPPGTIRSAEDLYKIPEHLQVPDRSNDLREQLNWLTGLTEVPLPISAKLKNIEATEKAKRALLKKGTTGETLDDEDDPDVVRRKAFGQRYTWFDPDRRQRVRAGDDRALQLFSQKGRRAQQMRGRVGIGYG